MKRVDKRILVIGLTLIGVGVGTFFEDELKIIPTRYSSPESAFVLDSFWNKIIGVAVSIGGFYLIITELRGRK